MVAAEATALTKREVGVLRLRADGQGDGKIADTLDTDGTSGLEPADVHEIERAAERTIERARRTLDLAATIQHGPVTFAAEAGTTIEALAEAVYDHGDDAAIDVSYCHADLRGHLRDGLGDRIEAGRLDAPATLTLTEDGEVTTGNPEGSGRGDEPDRATVADRD